MTSFKRPLKVNKTDAYMLNVLRWSSTEDITSLSVTTTSPHVTVGTSTVDGALLSVLLTGVSEGIADVHFEYSTPTRTDCYAAKVVVVADC